MSMNMNIVQIHWNICDFSKDLLQLRENKNHKIQFSKKRKQLQQLKTTKIDESEAILIETNNKAENELYTIHQSAKGKES